MDTLTQHVSIRKFTDRQVSPELLYQLLHAATRASTTGNMQLYSMVVNRDKEMIARMAPLHFNQPVARSAPVLVTFCADTHRVSSWCKLNQAKPGFDNFLFFMNGAIDALLAAQNLCVAAENCGLGICYLGTAVYNAPEISDLLKLPELCVPVTSVALGWPAESPPLTDRLPLNAVVHREVYGNYTNDDIESIYLAKEQLESSKRFVEENNKENLAQVFTDVRYKGNDNLFFSEKYLNLLKEKGFI